MNLYQLSAVAGAPEMSKMAIDGWLAELRKFSSITDLATDKIFNTFKNLNGLTQIFDRLSTKYAQSIQILFNQWLLFLENDIKTEIIF